MPQSKVYTPKKLLDRSITWTRRAELARAAGDEARYSRYIDHSTYWFHRFKASQGGRLDNISTIMSEPKES